MYSVQPIVFGAVRPRAFSLVELVIVVVIIGVISAIAVPRISGAATNASANALEATLANVRKAIDVYYAEHARYPGYKDAVSGPDNTIFVEQLLTYSNVDGVTNASFSSSYDLGPYLRPPFPTNPANKLNNVYVKANPAEADPGAGSYGRIAVLSNGDFGIIATDAELDKLGVKESTRKLGMRTK